MGSRTQEALKAWLDSESDYRLTEQKAQVRFRGMRSIFVSALSTHSQHLILNVQPAGRQGWRRLRAAAVREVQHRLQGLQQGRRQPAPPERRRAPEPARRAESHPGDHAACRSAPLSIPTHFYVPTHFHSSTRAGCVSVRTLRGWAAGILSNVTASDKAVHGSTELYQVSLPYFTQLYYCTHDPTRIFSSPCINLLPFLATLAGFNLFPPRDCCAVAPRP